jgi:hypothetical protein
MPRRASPGNSSRLFNKKFSQQDAGFLQRLPFRSAILACSTQRTCSSLRVYPSYDKFLARSKPSVRATRDLLPTIGQSRGSFREYTLGLRSCVQVVCRILTGIRVQDSHKDELLRSGSRAISASSPGLEEERGRGRRGEGEEEGESRSSGPFWSGVFRAGVNERLDPKYAATAVPAPNLSGSSTSIDRTSTRGWSVPRLDIHGTESSAGAGRGARSGSRRA